MYGVRTADTIKASGHCAPHQQAGHMTALDPTRPRHKILATQGPSTHDESGLAAVPYFSTAQARMIRVQASFSTSVEVA